MEADQVDVLLSYHPYDRAQVEALGWQLRTRRLKVVLSERREPWKPWPQELEEMLAQYRVVALCIGRVEMGSRQVALYLALQHHAANRGAQRFPIISVLLPGAEKPFGSPIYQWVDLRSGLDDDMAIQKLFQAIRDRSVGREAHTASQLQEESDKPEPALKTPKPQHAARAEETGPALLAGEKGLPWRTGIGRGVRFGTLAMVLIILVLGAWGLARWGLDELSASATVTRHSSACGTLPGFEPEMILVEGGEFQMGPDAGSASTDEQPVHTVNVKPFAIGTCEVTFEEYDRFAEETKRSLPHDEAWGRGRRPVINVLWEDAKAYGGWLSQQTGKRYRLPTEAEWEYAARSGGKAETWAGTSDEKLLPDYAVFRADRSSPAGSKKPNSVGLYDMSGNVWEWVEDCWHNSYQGAPTDGSAWLEGGKGDCGRRVIRGGSWGNGPENLRASNRLRGGAVDRDGDLGFRLVQDLEP